MSGSKDASQISINQCEALRLVSRALDIPVESITGEDSLVTLDAWDSIGHMRIILEIESAIAVELETEQILELWSVMDVARLLKAHQ